MRHHAVNAVDASEAAWKAAGAYTALSGEEKVACGPHGFEALLHLALHEGKTGDDAVAWAMAEDRRRKEADSLHYALRAQAEATEKLAAAIRQSGQDEALKAIMGRLSEKTQYAVRQQLGK